MKEHILTALMEQFNQWEKLLVNMGETQLLNPLDPSDWTIKDVIAHLMVWQKRSIARLQAAGSNREPEFPQWIPGLDPDAEGNTDLTNNWIYTNYRDKPWVKVFGDWREGFLHFMDLCEDIPERDLLDGGKYAWLEGQSLAVVLLSSYDHHQEHFEKLSAWINELEKRRPSNENSRQNQ
jgi:hypothetical protein